MSQQDPFDLYMLKGFTFSICLVNLIDCLPFPRCRNKLNTKDTQHNNLLWCFPKCHTGNSDSIPTKKYLLSLESWQLDKLRGNLNRKYLYWSLCSALFFVKHCYLKNNSCTIWNQTHLKDKIGALPSLSLHKFQYGYKQTTHGPFPTKVRVSHRFNLFWYFS